MPDTITRTTSQSWFSRIGGAVSGVLIGIVLIIGCVIGLAWNEGRAVQMERGLKEGGKVVISADAAAIDPANAGKLIHVSGPVVVTAPLEDPDFGVVATGVHLSRSVEMYQWKEDSRSETRTKLGGGEETVTTYSYSKAWSSQPIDSSAFAEPTGHQNPEFTLESADILAQDATLGAFKLQDNVVGRIDGAQPLRLTQDMSRAILAASADKARYVYLSQNRIMLTDHRPPASATDDAPAASDAAPTEVTPATTAIGDMRVSYQITPATEISIVGQQTGDTFANYRARNGAEFLLVENGDQPAAAMFQNAIDGNRMLTWVIRIVGLVLLCVGFGMIFAPLGVLADVLPLAGTIVRMGTGLVGFVLGIAVGTITIALAWFAFRPILSVIILAVGGAVAFGLYRLARGRNRKKLAEQAAAPAA